MQQIKGTEGVYIPGNPYSTLTSLADGKAYNILMGSPATWSVSGAPIPANTPLALVDGWNMTAFLPQSSLPVATAIASISTWLQQVKGTDGVYIPGNPYSTLTTMSPGKGYWIKISGAHSLIYPTTRGSDLLAADITLGRTPFRPEDKGVIATAGDTTPWQFGTLAPLSSSMTVLAKCEAAAAGDLLLAYVDGELRGQELLISPEGFAAALIQIYTETSGEEITFSIQKPDGSIIPLATKLDSEPQAILGAYPSFISLEPQPLNGEEPVPLVTGLGNCYPNPFRSSTHIRYGIDKGGFQVAIGIYNVKGQLVKSLVNEVQAKGNYQQSWDGTDSQGHRVSSGVYFILMRTEDYQRTIKVLLSK